MNEQSEEEKNQLDEWMKGIEVSGKEMRKHHEQLRAQIEALGPPDAQIVLDSEEERTLCMWKAEGGVTAIPFRKEIPDIYSIAQYTDEFIDALMAVKKCSEKI